MTDDFVLAQQFFRDGYVVVENALSPDRVARLRGAFMRAMTAKVERLALTPAAATDGRDAANDHLGIDFRPEGGNHDLNRWNMHLPTDPVFLQSDLLANPVMLPVIRHVLGGEPVAFLLASDTPYPGAGFQAIHRDFPRYGLTLNVALVDFTDDNAPLEVWPGSHVRDGRSKGVFHKGLVSRSQPDMQELVAAIAPRRIYLKAGSMLLRDQRLVHRGTANTGAEPRPALSIWYKTPGPFNIMALNIPVPHRRVADAMARKALALRRRALGQGGRIASRNLLNLGNFMGRLVEESSRSDRDYRRAIPAALWDGFEPELKSLLRYASVSGTPSKPGPLRQARSGLGSAILWTSLSAMALFAKTVR